MTAGALASLAISVPALLTAVLVGAQALAQRGTHLQASPRAPVTIACSLAANMLWATLGFALGALFRSQTAAIVTALLVNLTIDPAAQALAPLLWRFLPTPADQGLTQREFSFVSITSMAPLGRAAARHIGGRGEWADQRGIGQDQRLPARGAGSDVFGVDTGEHAAADPDPDMAGGPVHGGALADPARALPGPVGVSHDGAVAVDLSERHEPARRVVGQPRLKQFPAGLRPQRPGMGDQQIVTVGGAHGRGDVHQAALPPRSEQLRIGPGERIRPEQRAAGQVLALVVAHQLHPLVGLALQVSADQAKHVTVVRATIDEITYLHHDHVTG